MSTKPSIVERADQPYVAVRRSITMETFATVADRLPDVFGFLAARGIAPAGAPFFRYLVIDMERELLVEAGAPVTEAIDGDGDVVAGTLPSGRYVTTTHVGHPDELIDVTADLLAWAAGEGLVWDVRLGGGGDEWGCRLEVLKTNPAEQPDMSRWETELVFRLAD